MHCIVRLSVVAAAIIAVSGCSTWRCRGFIDTNSMPSDRPKHDYLLEGIDGGIDFRHLAPNNVEERARMPNLAWLSEQNALIATTYLDDISQELGLTNAVAGASRIRIGIVPIEEKRLGRSSIAWPMCCTFGVFPGHLADEISFDVIVQFIDRNPNHVYATAQVAQVKIDSQFGLSRLDMDSPPDAVSAVAEIRDEGTIGTGRGLRPQRLRDVFVKTVAAAVRRAIAERELADCEQTAQPSTEFGPVLFPAPIQAERVMTPGWGASRTYTHPVPKTLEDYIAAAWHRPDTEEAKKLKRLVEIGIMNRDEWRRQTTERWQAEKKGVGK